MPDTITGGIDTHLDVHVVADLNHIGRLLGVESFPADAAGYRRLLTWLQRFGTVALVGVEGTGSYGAGLTRNLLDKGVRVVEVDRPNRQERRRAGKSESARRGGGRSIGAVGSGQVQSQDAKRQRRGRPGVARGPLRRS